MYSLGLIGDLGSFKTCLLTSILIRSKKKIVANYKLNIAYTHMPFDVLAQVSSPKTLDSIRKQLELKLENSIIGVDELGKGADSYDFMENNVRSLGKLNTDLRKLGTRWIYTVPDRLSIAARLRRLTEGYILCEDADRYKIGHSWKTCDGIAILNVMDRNFNLLSQREFDGKPWYKFYNTKERVLA